MILEVIHFYMHCRLVAVKLFSKNFMIISTLIEGEEVLMSSSIYSSVCSMIVASYWSPVLVELGVR